MMHVAYAFVFAVIGILFALTLFAVNPPSDDD